MVAMGSRIEAVIYEAPARSRSAGLPPGARPVVLPTHPVVLPARPVAVPGRPVAVPGCPVAVPGGLMMLPVTDDLAADLAAWLEDADDGGHGVGPGWVLLRQPVTALARRLSAGGRALYVVGETFGGPGIQEAAGWRDGELWYGPCGTSDIGADLELGCRVVRREDSAINVGLRALGVRARLGSDEYETIGLTRHRHTED
jgi:hypothetical protein